MNCKNYRTRTKIGDYYGYCVLFRQKEPNCSECLSKEYKYIGNEEKSPYKPKNKKIRPIDKLMNDKKRKRNYLSNATNITNDVRNAVWLRDNGTCVLCGNHNALPNAHIISRSHLGLGIEENIITLCNDCHYEFDFTKDKQKHDIIIELISKYMRTKYIDWDLKKRVYKKGEYR